MRIFGLDIRRSVDLRASETSSQTRERVHRLEIDLATVQNELSALQGHHLKLRKQFDGSKGGRPVGGGGDRGDLNAIEVGDKAALRAYAGLRPGQPVRTR